MLGNIISDLKWLRMGKSCSYHLHSMSFWTKLGYFWKMEGEKMRDLKWPVGATSYISRNLGETINLMSTNSVYNATRWTTLYYSVYIKLGNLVWWIIAGVETDEWPIQHWAAARVAIQKTYCTLDDFLGPFFGDFLVWHYSINRLQRYQIRLWSRLKGEF